ncbi:MAG: hypothetical protein LBR34_10135 [Prevotella sp.]|nr:hypothetical protein [Prevotella sp.]
MSKVLFVLLWLGVFPDAWSQCDYSIQVSITHSDCNENGEISISLSGDALLGTTDSDRSYRVYPAGTPTGSLPAWSSSNHWANLAPGNYTVDTRVFCVAGGGVFVDQQSFNHLINQTYAWDQLNFMLSQTESHICRATGTIAISAIVGSAKGPYYVVVTQAPQSYIDLGHPLPDTVYTKLTDGLPTAFTLSRNFFGGNYRIKMSDGCGGARSVDITVGTSATNQNYPVIYGTSKYNPAVCTYDSVGCYIRTYNASSIYNQLPGATITYLGASTSSSTSTTDFNRTSQTIAPQSPIVVPKTFPVSTAAYICPYAADPCNPNNTIRGYVSNKPSDAPNSWAYGTCLHFQVTDTCGVSSRIAVACPTAPFEYNAPVISVVNDCGYGLTTISNITTV